MRLLAERDKDRAIVRSIVDGKNLGLLVVAEGVEDQAAWDTLTDLSCDHVQGYFLSRPIPAAGVLGWLDRYEPDPRGGMPVSAASRAELRVLAPRRGGERARER